MNTIQVGGLLQPGTVDTVLDARARVETLDDIQNIQLPFVGMVFFVRETGRLYIVKTLKSRTIGVVVSENVAVGEYEEVPAMSSLNWFPSGPFLVWNGAHSLRMLAGTGISVGSGGFSTYEDVELDVTDLLDTGTIQPGKDYCVYLTTDQQFVVSLNSTFPTGTLADGSTAFSAENTRKIGGFHTLCVDAGEIDGHPLSGFEAGDILPASVWCLNHRPYSEPAGMVYVNETNSWVDIYNCSGAVTCPESTYGGTRLHSVNYYAAVEALLSINKSPIDDKTFVAAMRGSNTGTLVAGSAQPEPDTTGGHSDTAGRRMVSNLGCEEGCGLSAAILAETGASGGSGSSEVTSIFGGSGGFVFGIMYTTTAGGSYSTQALACGTMCRGYSFNSTSVNAGIGIRGLSKNKEGDK